MDSVSLAQWATYVSYVFVIAAYSFKVIKYFRMPLHLRWELYPVPHEKNNKYGGSYMEEPEWWTKPRPRKTFRNILDMLKRYLFFGEYFRKVKGYWAGLYPWHTGFYLIVLFDGLTMLGGILLVTTGITISGSAGGFGVFLYYLTLVVAIVSFITGIIGSIILLIKRLADKDLKNYASPINYFNYIFFLLVFVSGLVSWAFYDPTLSGYRDFWAGIFSYKYAAVDAATYAHIILFSLFLIYLPFTRSTHYITKMLAFFSVRWDDRPNLRGNAIEAQINKQLGLPVTWSAAHVQSGKSWGEVAQGMPEDNKEKQS
jgi:nitrate reductase gamma subunit